MRVNSRSVNGPGKAKPINDEGDLSDSENEKDAELGAEGTEQQCK